VEPARPSTGTPQLPSTHEACRSTARRAFPPGSGRSRHCSRQRSGGCHPPPGARSWRFYAFSEPLEQPVRSSRNTLRRTRTNLRLLAPPLSRPGLFHPGNAPELSPSGLCSPRRSGPVSEPDPPVLLRRHRGAARQLRRFTPSEEAARAGKPTHTECPHGVVPSEALPPAALEPASRLFLSRACPAAPRPAGEPTNPDTS